VLDAVEFLLENDLYWRWITMVQDRFSASVTASVQWPLLFDLFELDKVTLAVFGSMSIRYVDHSFQILCPLFEVTALTPAAIGVHVNRRHAYREENGGYTDSVSIPLMTMMPSLTTG
jgi:hypothetical protein